MSRVKLTIATTDYDHFRDFRLGLVTAEGIDHTWLTLGHHEVFARFTFNREWDVSELSFAKFSAQVTREASDIIGLPVVCSRLFRFSSFYVNKNSKIRTAADLKGKTIGSPEWAHTAAVYMRGWLNDEHGIKLQDVHWYQAGANEAGRIEKVELAIPKGVELTRVSDKSLSEMIASGEIDCALIARPPNSFLQGHPDVVRLFPNYLEMEEAYYRRTRVWPIMHIIAIQKRVLDEHPWVARNLYNAFVESKRRSLEAPARSRGLALPARLAADLRAQDARSVRRRPVPVRHRREQANAGAVPALYLRAGHRPSPCRARRDFPQGHHDVGADMISVL
jgi:4,5-dihydroxyphthalate decarboxylase